MILLGFLIEHGEGVIYRSAGGLLLKVAIQCTNLGCWLFHSHIDGRALCTYSNSWNPMQLGQNCTNGRKEMVGVQVRDALSSCLSSMRGCQHSGVIFCKWGQLSSSRCKLLILKDMHVQEPRGHAWHLRLIPETTLEGGERELTTAKCLLTFIQVLWHAHK